MLLLVKIKIISIRFIPLVSRIPDTSERDSLFQAEAQRCKEIIDYIDDNNDKRHMCIFDELYSGTNPEDAVEAGYVFLQYINKKTNVKLHDNNPLFDLCDKLKKEQNMKLSCMCCNETERNRIYI